MKSIGIRFFAGFAAILALVSCESGKNSFERYKQDGLVYNEAPEAVSGKVDVYQSMARAVKYNVDNASINLSKKVFSQDPGQEPKTVVRNIMNKDVSDHTPLFEASNVLEYAIIYAVANLQDTRPAIDLNLYLKSSQHLSLAAIRSHQDSWFAKKKIKEVDRILARENKNLEALNQKMERQGTLNAADLDYKKNLEVSLLRLNEIRKGLAFRFVEYGELIKANPETVELEGRRFYELEDFDKKYNLEIFQEAAVRNRTEFAIAKENVKSYGFEEVRDNAVRKYPEIVRLDINGISIANDFYRQELKDRAVLIANNLIDAVSAYRRATALSKDTLRKEAFDELGAAILAQIQINYCMVKLADMEYNSVSTEISGLKKTILALERNPRAGQAQKLELFNQRIKLFELQQRQAQIQAERAVALRSLYFNAGLSPFSKRNLKMPVKDISSLLKTSFNKDLLEMLAAASVEAKAQPKPQQNDWAKKDNWLEDLMRQSYRGQSLKTERNLNSSIPEASKLQLGSYVDKNNAYVDWEKMKSVLPALKTYQPRFEEVGVQGTIYWRMLLSPESKDLQPLCEKILASGFDCLPRK